MSHYNFFDLLEYNYSSSDDDDDDDDKNYKEYNSIRTY